MSDDKLKKKAKIIGEFVKDSMAGFMFGDGDEQIPLKLLRETMKGGLKATKTVATKRNEPLWTARGKKAEREEFVYSKPMRDWPTRSKYLDMATKMVGGYPAQKVDHSGEVEHVVKDQLTPAVQEVFEKIVKRDKK